MGQTLIEKIVNRYATGLKDGQLVYAGDFVSIRPKHVMTHDNTAAVIPKFNSIGAKRVHDPQQPVFCLDHDIQNTSPDHLGKYAKIQRFAETHGIDFYPAGSGIGHQIMVEQGYAIPGALVVASDSHSNLYGGAAALGTPVVRTDAAAIWATSETWWQVPDVVKVELRGRLRSGVVGKDVIIALCGAFNKDEVLNCVVEFVGDGVAALSMDQRLTIANMTTEWGTLAGVFPFDEVLRDYLYVRADVFAREGEAPAEPIGQTARREARPPISVGQAPAEPLHKTPRYTRNDVDHWYAERLRPDPDAYYAKELTIDLAQIVPHVAGPNEVKVIMPVSEIAAKTVKVDKAYLLSCVNARLEDIQEAAGVVKDKKVAAHVKLYLSAASAEVEANARRLGYWNPLLAAGAIALPSGCGPCIGLGEGTLQSGEVGISATNRNFKGRMGARDAQVYLASPAIVAASAVAGYICGPGEYPAAKLVTQIKVNPRQVRAAGATEILPGFPISVTGRLLYLPKDNLNTDGIYGSEYTYKDNLTPQEMGQVAMLNYDPEFQKTAREGDIIVGGRNFGSGSSREQAATALAGRGIRMVIAASFSQTYSRNAFNNGFIVIECPELVDDLVAEFNPQKAAGQLTIPTTTEAKVDFARSVIEYRGKSYAFPALGRVPQEIIIAGGVENLVQRRLQTK